MLRITTLIILTITAATSAFAQKKIEDIIQSLSNEPKVDLIYSEQRDPETHQITSSSCSYTSRDKVVYKKLYDAIQAERHNSISYSQVGKEVITIGFLINGRTKTYSLINDGGEWMLSTSESTSTKKTSKSKPTRRTKPDNSVSISTSTSNDKSSTMVYINGERII